MQSPCSEIREIHIWGGQNLNTSFSSNNFRCFNMPMESNPPCPGWCAQAPGSMSCQTVLSWISATCRSGNWDNSGIHTVQSFLQSYLSHYQKTSESSSILRNTHYVNNEMTNQKQREIWLLSCLQSEIIQKYREKGQNHFTHTANLACRKTPWAPKHSPCLKWEDYSAE